MDRKFDFFAPVTALFALALGTTAVAAPPNPQPNRLATLPIGTYECSLPGDASGPAWNRIPDSDFKILNASSYEAKGSSGVYLLRGTQVTFTRGPMKGTTMERVGRSMLRERQADGSLGRMRCVRTGQAG